MTIKMLLLIMVVHSPGSKLHVQRIEFSNPERCFAAREVIIQRFAQIGWQAYVDCVAR